MRLTNLQTAKPATQDLECSLPYSTTRPQNRRRRGLQSGFTLIEVMVTVFVMAVGMLGVAGMQAVSVRESQNTYYRTQADLLASDMVDRMRANRTGSRSGNDNGYLAAAPVGSANCSSTCDEDNMADFDLKEWHDALTASSLPTAAATITLNQDLLNPAGVTIGSVYTVQIFWDENRDGSTGRGCDPSSAADMSCIRLVVQI